jgi:hypothetical protein
MSDKKSITFCCDADILEALNNLGRECYHAKTPHRYDRSKILMDILRLNIEALSDGSIVLYPFFKDVIEIKNVKSKTIRRENQ